ncbi:carbon-nitrogen hydrolase family protein [Pseudomonas solani]|uniref:nitrilase-related carbon-nitrogen hydrolase n=1 Tax=Pseudomonas solani TaxID=2731552 RepID=UPI0035BE3693
MRKLLIVLASALFAGVLVSYAIWTDERPVGHYLSDLRSEVALNLGEPGERGNLLGIQPELFAADYQSVDRLRLKLAAYLEKARSEGLLNERTIVVLPEHIGTWLVAAGEKNQVYSAHSLDDAMLWLAAANPMKLARALVAAEGKQRLVDALFRMKATRMAGDYQTLFGGLARDFGITLVAGSILLPEPRIEGGNLLAESGPLYNVSLVFDHKGLPIGQPQRKLYPIRDEQGFTAAAGAEQLKVLDTPAGRLGVLICADSWYPAGYAALREQGVELLAVPAFLSGNGSWSKPWNGYNGAPTPADVKLRAGELSEGEAWQRLAMAGRLPDSGARAGLTVFLRGQLWDLGSDGPGLGTDANGTRVADAGRGARLLNIWL